MTARRKSYPSSWTEIGWRAVLKGSNDVTMTRERVVVGIADSKDDGNGNSVFGKMGLPYRDSADN